jgi:diguanylate cyclase (GGDEF)-like protein
MIGNELINVLLVEDDLAHAQLMEELFWLVGSHDFRLVHSLTLGDALNRLLTEQIDIVLLDLNLPDSQGYDTFQQIQEFQVDVPVILLTATNNEQIALKAIQNGAQDFLVKGEVDAKLLIRAVRYALERHQMQSELRSMSLTDELTGLYNRRGFSTLAGQHLKLARRTGQGFFIIFADLDELKRINDTYGHAEGDAILIATAGILRKSFRESDILARYGGDEFLVLATDAVNNSRERIYRNLKRQADMVNQSRTLKSYISLSLGVILFEPGQETNVDKLVAEADKALYEDKQLSR